MKKAIIFFLLVGYILHGCSKQDKYSPPVGSINELENGWAVPLDQLVISLLPADRIKSIDTPTFEIVANSNLRSNDAVYAYRYADTVKIYPQRILSKHEIVNDRIGNHYFAITYCPLTGSAIAWNREINGEVSEFGVSGHLYNENLIAYDRNGNSYWSQMLLEGIKGNSEGDNLKNSMLLFTSGETIKKSYPDALILVDSTDSICNDSICGFKQGSDYGNPDENEITNLLTGGNYFGVVNTGILNGGQGALLFSYDDFNDSISIYQTNYKNSRLIVIGSSSLQFIVAFIDKSSNSEIHFNAIQNSLPTIFEDNQGNNYDITGLIISGPSAGIQLPSPIAYTANSYAWELFFGNGIQVFKN
jgi:hypothetical protein